MPVKHFNLQLFGSAHFNLEYGFAFQDGFQRIARLYGAYTFWGAGEDKVPDFQRVKRRYKGDDFINRKDHISSMSRLLFFTIDQ